MPLQMFTPGTNVVFSNMYNISLIVIRYNYLYKYTAYVSQNLQEQLFVDVFTLHLRSLPTEAPADISHVKLQTTTTLTIWILVTCYHVH